MTLRHLSWLVIAAVVCGCGGTKGDPNRPKTVPVTGTVSYKGQSVEGATVTFIAGASGGRGAVGKTDASGRFTMTTFEAKDGAIPGSYRVVISKSIVEGAPEEGATKDSSGTMKELLPAKYKEAGKSGLTAEVKQGAANDLKFELTD